MRVEQIQSDDHVWDVRSLACLHNEEFGGWREFDSSAVVASAHDCIKDTERKFMNCWIVYDSNNVPLGYLAATCARNFYSYRNIARQEMWYVTPQARGSRAAVLLVRAFEQWAHELKCEQIYMGVEHNEFSDVVAKVANIITRMGYKARGLYMIKRTGQ